ncbi:UPF0496 protein At3g19330 [Mercurialis annua]|uniref:UPF0496 protein At3g19330 n=1 Tax=Mercurialis annua TaxID=3986 RepID=UPI00215F836C|nr:UPF0496 protein At3g19330 [Mercurialis annua]
MKMLQCLSLKSPSAATSTSVPNSPPTTIDIHHHDAGTSTDGTPTSSAIQSPCINLTREYTLYIQSNSYNEICSRIHQDIETGEQIEFHVNNDDENARQLLLNQVLHPNRQCVEEALRHAKPNTLTRLVSDYFDHSESTTDLCLVLHRSVFRARAVYKPIHNLLEVLPVELESLTQAQCDYAYEMFLQLDRVENPFPCPDNHSFQGLRGSFSDLKQQLDRRLVKSRSRVRLVHRAAAASALCVIGTAVSVTMAALVISGHALVAIVACPFCAVAGLPRKLTNKELAHVKQLEAASRGTFVLNGDLDTIDRLATRLFDYIENDKLLLRMGLERGCDKHPISEVLKYLRKNHLDFIEQLKDLEEHICLYFNAVNRARRLLLEEIHVFQTSDS